ncbi:DEAD/DEAH box helicase [Cellulomonas sp. SLBN-39]|uniref:DEAD/DEAH box helicase n=1 Tax=Cellulomonas sp. SLBN-39 TaxID=2768446 RepID=UPI0011511013|nr:DEAD/DEAH box helicase [Cellulomonas sp. SLBN-39]TQL01025.1 superfamily II DNA or RNA helicase [Cellulomonas sp. SLBN-39]
MSAARRPASLPTPTHTPQHPSSSAASQLPPAFPARAPWGAAGSLRAWQAEAIEQYRTRAPRDFLAVATPGAGKTTFALRIATELLEARVVRRVTVVAPTEHLKKQWADAAARVGIRLDPRFTNAQGRHGAGYDGVAVTYAQVASKPALHAARTGAEPTLVILDEVHHGGDALSWGDAVREAFEGATRRLALTGTPFRSDTAPIPFVQYAPDGQGIRRSVADYTYGYGEALRDHVVRPVIFLSYSGSMRWRTKAGDEIAARLGEPLTKDMTAQAWRTALNPEGEWIPSVLQAADRRLTEVRRAVPDAGAMVIATDQTDARAYAGHLARITGTSPTVVLSDDDGASDRIEEFAASDSRWLVAVRMVSEGVDVPRLAVGVYATSTSTPLFFAQAVGRFVRARRRGETASVFLPSVPTLLELASTMEVERDHALDRPTKEGDDLEASLLLDAQTERRTADAVGADGVVGAFQALEAQASFDRVLFDGGEFGTGAEVGSDEELDFLGLPGLLDADQVTTLLRQRQADQQGARRAAQQPPPKPEMDHRQQAALRKELAQLVGAWARRSGQPHATVHAELRRRCGGPEVALAAPDEIQQRVDMLRGWFVGRR